MKLARYIGVHALMTLLCCACFAHAPVTTESAFNREPARVGGADAGGSMAPPLPPNVHFAYNCKMTLVQDSAVATYLFSYDETSGNGSGWLQVSPTSAMWKTNSSEPLPKFASGNEFHISTQDASLTMVTGPDQFVSYPVSPGLEFNQNYQPTKSRLVMLLEQRTGQSHSRRALSVVCDKRL